MKKMMKLQILNKTQIKKKQLIKRKKKKKKK